MAEPEGLLIEGARLATATARDLWWRVAPPSERVQLPLTRVRQRLEFFLGALYAGAPTLLPADAPPAPVWLARLTGRAPRHLRVRTATAATDGAHIWLPRALDASKGEATALAAYRLLAVEQAARAARDTPGQAPPARPDRLERDLYLLAEAVALDAAIAGSFPGLVADLRTARRGALAERPPLAWLTPSERAVERLLQDTLSAEPSTTTPGLPFTATPSASRAWAGEMARRVRAVGGRYRGVAIVPLWGQVMAVSGTARRASPARTRGPSRGPHAPGARRSAAAPWRARPARTRTTSAPEPGWSGPTIQWRAWRTPWGSSAPPTATNPPIRTTLPTRSPSSPRRAWSGRRHAPRGPGERRRTVARAPRAAERAPAGAGIVYPEWDYRTGVYRAHGAVVWPVTAPAGAGHWVDGVLARHARLVRQVRRRFDGPSGPGASV